MVVRLILGSTICFAAMAQNSDPGDPVLKAKAIRALENGKDLPPIPRGLIEPPPLPPPELHLHDIRKGRGVASKSKKPVAKSSIGAQKSQAGASKPAAKPTLAPQQKPKQGAAKATNSAKPPAKPVSSAQKPKIGAAK